MTHIPGPLRYDELASLNRPRDTATLAAEVRRLLATGLSVRDIATALRLDLATVLDMLAMKP